MDTKLLVRDQTVSLRPSSVPLKNILRLKTSLTQCGTVLYIKLTLNAHKNLNVDFKSLLKEELDL